MPLLLPPPPPPAVAFRAHPGPAARGPGRGESMYVSGRNDKDSRHSPEAMWLTKRGCPGPGRLAWPPGRATLPRPFRLSETADRGRGTRTEYGLPGCQGACCHWALASHTRPMRRREGPPVRPWGEPDSAFGAGSGSGSLLGTGFQHVGMEPDVRRLRLFTARTPE